MDFDSRSTILAEAVRMAEEIEGNLLRLSEELQRAASKAALWYSSTLGRFR